MNADNVNSSHEYTLDMHIGGRFTVSVQAEDLESAKEAADAIYADADFGELEDIDREYIWYSIDGDAGHYLN